MEMQMAGLGEGVVNRCDHKKGLVSVHWDGGNYGFYKMGADGKFELKTAPKKVNKPQLAPKRKDPPAVIVEEVKVIEPVKEVIIEKLSCAVCNEEYTENGLSRKICPACTSKYF